MIILVEQFGDESVHVPLSILEIGMVPCLSRPDE